ncbi:MAG: GxxExxY protein [Verrucomicrobiota bacterium]
MPVLLRKPVRRLTQAEFGELAYSVMACVFKMHAEMGRFFDEKIYKRELSYRHRGVELEVPIEVKYESFTKTLYMDVLVDSGGPFEFKTVAATVPRHSSQLLQYMLLSELGHGKLVNLRKESVEHEFVNTTLTLDDRRYFKIEHSNWNDKITGANFFECQLTGLLRDWGTGLETELYQEAITSLVLAEGGGLEDVDIRASERTLGHQTVHMAAPGVAFALTSLPKWNAEYESHLQRFRRYTTLNAILWANISLKKVTFTTIR